MRTEFFFLPVFFNGSILDVETDRANNLTCFGLVSGSTGFNCIKEYFDNDFYRSVFSKHMTAIRRPIYSFNKAFEEKVLGIRVDNEIQLYPFEKKKYAIHIDKLNDPFNGDGYKCIEAWESYLDTREMSYLKKIVEHNKACLLQELCLVLSQGFRKY